MNNTLTGLGLALVLALLAALIGPWFVNWSAYRDVFAARASALVGAPVTVTGAVDARLLPTPYVRFRGLTSGSGATKLVVDEVEIELAIAPLMRGEIKAERLKLVRPRLGVEIAADGSVRTAFSAQSPARGTEADRVSFDRAEIIDGAVAVSAPWGAWRLDAVSGVAEAGSLAGPYRFEGSAGPEAARLDLRLATARADQNGLTRLKASAARVDRTLTIEADGALRIATRPGFDGRVAVSRPAARPGQGQGGQPARAGGAAANEPWRASAGVKAEGGTVRLGDLELAYGPDDRGLRLNGSAVATLAASPQVDLRLETRQIDFDRLLGDGRPRTPAGVLSEIASRLPAGLAAPAGGSLVLDARGVVLAGGVVQDLRVELATEAERWRVRRASATLPGDAKVSGSGAVAFSGEGAGFVGPVEFDARDLAAFRRWLDGGQETGSALLRRFALKGDVAARAGSVIVENAALAADGARSTGRLAWTAAQAGGRPRIEAALVSDNLDLDALGLDRVLKRAVSDHAFDGVAAIDAKALTAWGVAMRDVSLDASFDAGGVDLKRLQIRDAGGARISGGGRIASGASGPEGRLGFKVAAERLGPLVSLLRAAGAPEAAVGALEARSAALAPVDLSIDLEAGPSLRRVSAYGAAAGGRLDGAAQAPELSLDAPAEIEVVIDTSEGARLAALAGLAVSPLAEAKGGEARLKLSGALSKAMTGEGRFAALGLDLTGRGSVALAPEAGLSAKGEVSLRAEDLSTLAALLGRATPVAAPRLPATLEATFAYDAEGLRLDPFAGDVAGRAVSGRFAAPADPARSLEGRFALQELPIQTIAALALSPEATANAGPGWPTAPFGPSPVRGLNGRFEIKAARLPLGGGRVATDAGFTLALKRDAVAVEGLTAALDGGRLSGGGSVTRAGDDTAAAVALQLEGVDLDRLLGLDGPSPSVSGTADLKLEAQGSGRRAADLVGSMTGAGSLAVRDLTLRRLDPGAIARIEPQVEAGLTPDAGRIGATLAREFAAADLRAERAVAPFTLSGGVFRTGGLEIDAGAARLGGAASFDLKRLTLDADLTLQPKGPDAPQVGVSFEGPLAAPARRVDATSFTGWLSVRAVERETKRIEAMEADARERARIARERQEAERKRQEEERKRQEEERLRAEAEKARLDAERRAEAERKAEADRKRRESEPGAPAQPAPRVGAPALPNAIDVSPPALTLEPRAPAAPPAGAFSPQAQQPRPAGPRVAPADPATLPAPRSILPPPAATAR